MKNSYERSIYETVTHLKDSRLRIYRQSKPLHFPPHWHNDIEIIIVESGNLRVDCQSDTYSMKKGDILLICPASIHEIGSEPDGSRFYIQANMSGFSFLTELSSAFAMMSPAALITPDTMPDVYPSISADIQEIQQLYYEITYASSSSEMYSMNSVRPGDDQDMIFLPFMAETKIISLLLDTIQAVARTLQKDAEWENDSPVHSVSRNQKAIAESRIYIADHFSGQITLEETAAHCGFSKYHYERLFKQFAGITFYQYVTKVRLACAQQLLGDPTLSVTEVALKSGFSSGSSFARAFREATGFSPSDFRKINESRHPLFDDPKFRKHFKEEMTAYKDDISPIVTGQ